MFPGPNAEQTLLFCTRTKWQVLIFVIYSGIREACIGVLGIQDICHFTSRDIGYYPFYFQGYGMLCSIFSVLPGILNI